MVKPEYQDYLKICDFVADEAPAMVAKTMGQWTLFRLTENAAARRFDLFVNPRGKALASITRKSDGTIGLYAGGRHRPNADLNGRWTKLVSDLQQDTQAKIFLTAAKRFGHQKMILAIAHWDYHGNTQAKAALAANRALQLAFTCYETPQGVVSITDVSLKAGWQSLIKGQIEKHLLDRKTLDLTSRAFQPRWRFAHSSGITVDTYNRTVLNQAKFQAMLEESPQVLNYFAVHVTPFRPARERYRTPEKIAALTKDILELDDEQWAFFTKILPLHWTHKPIESRVKLKMSLQTLVEANVPDARPERLREVAGHNDDHLFFRYAASGHASFQHGSPWQLWIDTVRTFLRDTNSATASLSSVSQCLRWHVEQNQPWEPTNWKACQERYSNWQRDMWKQKDEQRQQELANARWESLVGNLTLGQYRFEAVTDGPALKNAIASINHRIPLNLTMAVQGQQRTFLVHRNDAPVGVATLRQSRGKWFLEHVMQSHYHRVSTSMRKQALNLLQMYQQEDENRKRPETAHPAVA